MGNKFTRSQILTVVISFVVIAALAWGIMQWRETEPVNASEVSVIALQQSANGVAVDSAFQISFGNEINAGTVKDQLVIKPAFAYDLKKEAGGKSYRIIPHEPLANNAIYKFAFDPSGQNQESLSWAFQTVGEFRVLGTLPRPDAVGVPADSGIEITFSHENFDLDQASKLFRISPQTAGRFEKHQKTMVFIPKKLDPATIYTVTLLAGLAGDSKQTIAENYQIRFETASSQAASEVFNFYLEDRVTEFNTEQLPTFPLSLANGAAIPQPMVELYQFADAESYGKAQQRFHSIPFWSMYAEEQYRQDVRQLDHQASYQTEFKPAGQYKYLITLPDQLGAGYYLIEVKAGKQVKQAIFQISDLAVYRVQSQQQTMFWINDLISQRPVAAAEIWLDNQKIAAGDNKGVVLVNDKLTAESTGRVIIKAGGKQLLVPLDSSDSLRSPAANTRNAYWKYLYLDRELYLPGDTVHYWGVIAPRGKSEEIKDPVTLELWGGDYYYSEQRSVEPLYSQVIKVNGNTYSGACKLPVLKPGYYYLSLKLNDIELTSRGFNVATYQKPAYQVSIVPDKKAIIVGDQVNYLVKSTFFEGTPVPGLSLNYYLNEKASKIVTNHQGEAAVTYQGHYRSDNFAPYSYEYFNVNASTPESGDIGDYNGVLVFPSAIMVRAEAKTKGANYELTAKLNQIDLGAINNGGNISEENYVSDPVPSGKITAKLYKEVWTRNQTGEAYDYINKQVVPIYNYQFSTQHISTFDLVTNQKGEVKYQGNLDKGYSYYLELTSPDQKGRLGRARVYVGEFYDELYTYSFYSFKDSRNKPYLPGDQVSLDLMKNSTQLDPAGRSILFFRGQEKIESYLVSSEARYGFKFTDHDIPNTNVWGVYFDGDTYQETSNHIVTFDRQSRNLQVNITTDQKEYRPGETVNLSVKVTDTKGKAVKNAHLNLNLVDEALYRLMDQQVDILQGLYGEYLVPALISWKSHNHPQLGGGAEQGGEGSGERRDFRDTVLFKDLITDSSGLAAAAFKLPDNLTSWRVTYHAVTSGLQASSGTSKIPVRLPFFVNMNVNTSYHQGDSPIFLLRSYGNKLKSGQAVNYQITMIGPDGKQEVKSGTSKAFNAYEYAVADLKTGRYTLKAAASSGSYKDTIVQSFQVTDNIIKRQIVEPMVLKGGSKITSNSQQPVTLVFSDRARSQNLEGLYQLSWLYGSRVEHRVASSESRKLLAKYFPSAAQNDLIAQSSILNYQQADGGISILPYGSSDLQVSAHIAAIAPQEFDRRALSGYFYRLLDESKAENRSLIWLGLASLDEPVLLSIQEALKSEKLTPEEIINLNLALLELGDGAQARELYQQLMAKHGQNLGNSTRINVGKDQDDIIAATTQMALLAARLDQPEKTSLLAYLLENPGEDIVNSLEVLQILKYNLQYLSKETSSFTYQLHGKKVNCLLKDDQTVKLEVLPEDLRGLSFSQVKGQVGVLKYYSEPVPAATGINEGLSIQRSYSVGAKTTLNPARTDLVKVVIQTNISNQAPGGSYEIRDVLPAGMAYLERPYTPELDIKNMPDWPAEVNGRELTFVVSKGQSRITYYARVTTPGKYQAEAPLLQHSQHSKVYVRGSEQELIIK